MMKSWGQGKAGSLNKSISWFGYYFFLGSMYAIMRANYELYICNETPITFYVASGSQDDSSVGNYVISVQHFALTVRNLQLHVRDLLFKVIYLCFIFMFL
jgi:hypothetical protein